MDHLPINVRTSLLEAFGIEATWNFGTYINIGIVVAYVSIINIRYNWKRTLLSVITNNTTVIERSFYMPENKLENFVFTVIMAFLMVYAMICYNIALNIGGMKDTVFLMAFHELIIMWPVAIILEMFIMEKPVMTLTSRVVTEDMPFFFMLLARCALTVCLMCPAMSLVATFLFKEYHDAGFVSVFLQTAALNFPMALCWQIFFAGPAGRWIFRALFRRKHTACSEESAL